MNKLKIENVVFCEQIRAEMGGKYTLLGAYAPELNIGEIPANIAIAIWISGTPSGVGPFDVEFRARGVDGTVLINGKMNGDFGTLTKTSMVIWTLPLMISSDGEYTFEWNFSDTKWEKIGTLLIHHVPAGSIVNPPDEQKPPS